ncbi:MAG: AraC family transcriptional regulator [Bacteroidales bacterium]|nr:AraC family transcriptional regulator [Bacteroidales bacterium]
MTTTPYLEKSYHGLTHIFATGEKNICIEPFRCHTFMILREGIGVFSISKEKIRIAKGDCVCIIRNPEAKLLLSPAKNSDVIDVLMLEIPRSYLINYYRNMSHLEYYDNVRNTKRKIVQMPNTRRMREFCEAGWQLLLQDEALTLNAVDRLRKGIVDRVLAIDAFMFAHFFDFLPRFRVSTREFLQQIYCLRLSVDEMANYASRSKASFKRDVLAVMGTSPERAIINLRLQQARVLLSRGEKPTTVAKQLGFVSYQHFANRYKKMYGCIPSQTDIVVESGV